jgi:hypothetical protein
MSKHIFDIERRSSSNPLKSVTSRTISGSAPSSSLSVVQSYMLHSIRMIVRLAIRSAVSLPNGFLKRVRVCKVLKRTKKDKGKEEKGKEVEKK